MKRAVPATPVLANTGVRHETVAEVLAIADGCIVGSALKVISETIPRSCWTRRIRQEGDLFTVEGSGVSDGDARTFAAALETRPDLRDVRLVTTSESTAAPVHREFVLEFKVPLSQSQ